MIQEIQATDACIFRKLTKNGTRYQWNVGSWVSFDCGVKQQAQKMKQVDSAHLS